ncbi:hypothetical protein HF086_013607 [Spodoptera exigua]|uniref:Transcription factor Adf-1 n=1 Tax=Spodoptera exigua TaxID=7107 RepID=A0A922M8D4_SPOEX|nr:hypothetical protein HF086_013607 [Spodoptera exigua]
MSEVELLINAIQKRPTLWDKRNKSYHNRLLSHREWEAVAKIIGTTSEMTKKKWKNLRDTFSKELKKNPKPRSGTDADNEPKYTGTWLYIEAMSFFKVVLKPRQTEGNIISKDSENNSVDLSVYSDAACPEEIFNMNASDNDNTQLPESASILEEIPQNMSIDNNLRQDRPPSPSLPGPSPSSSLPAIIRQTRKRKDVSLEAFLDIEREKMKILREDQPDNRDDDLLWFKSKLPYMKQLPSLKKLHFRTQMQELLLMELSKLNPPQSSAQQHGYYTSL